ncbi:alpha/beta hydrolase, putative [Talaromyces stipitatus ATCC 10500]|uniref:Alpha/beta hydrolase, putative n=1 Tax=Talaromyces stipitatus (strain ATCC 10500 / CBS 375.48 / QM 6759 / NRRL 1006) TaxID=441959 RepID=B8M5V9_TALSN|nr:alpha/beta hydrolase, putative [Talaromyces stipitatus ATCC 10500]EED20086.1 alpha/beta hydrolase, putative [Talaromyces stipitatus ATCC 10500]
MAKTYLGALNSLLIQAIGLMFMLYYWFLTIINGQFFKKPTAEYKSELALARDHFWNLSKQPFDLHHRFLTLRDGFKFHYVTNAIPDPQTPASKPLVIFVHGFPDSWVVWRYVMGSIWLRETSNLVAVDLPGYGGSDLLKRYSATEVHEKMTEFIISLRELYGIDNPERTGAQQRVIIVAHDWGCVISMRLAADAPQLADRFVLTNGPLISLVQSNIKRLISSSVKMLKLFSHSPLQSRSMVKKALHTMNPVIRQAVASGYVFALQLALPIVRLQGSGGDTALLRAIHKMAHGVNSIPSAKEIAEGVAGCLGPSLRQENTETSDSERYSKDVVKQSYGEKYVSMTNYYRQGTSTGRWKKSLETITGLYSLSDGGEIRRKSSHSGVFDEGPEGSLKAKATIVWGMEDVALNPHLNLDGIADYLSRDSQVVTLPRAGHHTPVEKESRLALQKVVEWAVAGEEGDVGSVAKAVYPGAVVTVTA